LNRERGKREREKEREGEGDMERERNREKETGAKNFETESCKISKTSKTFEGRLF
jgi:hypothetical protein